MGATAPGAADVATWDSTVATAANCTNTLGGAVSWGGILISNPAVSVKVLTTASILSIGSSGIILTNSTVSLWMATASFYVNQVNHPPYPVVIPAGQWILDDINGVLTWYPTTDPDEVDYISLCRVQVSLSGTFSVLLMDSTVVLTNVPVGPYGTFSVPLNAFAGASNLVSGSTYHWRVSARDNRGAWSDWPSGDYAFRFGSAPLLVPALFTRIWRTAGGDIVIEWDPSPNNIYVEFSTNLQSGSWTNIAGPLTGTSWTNAVDPGKPSGFYRLRSE